MASSQSEPETPPGGSSGAPESSAPEAQPLVETKKRGGLNALTVVLVAIIIILAGALAVVALNPFKPAATQGTFAVQSVKPTVVQNEPLEFSIQNVPSGDVARVYTGDGQSFETTGTSYNYTYTQPGNYLVYVQELDSKGNVVSDLAGQLTKVTVLPDIPTQLSQYVSVPTIYFNTNLTGNANAPIFNTVATAYLFGNYTSVVQLFSSSTTHTNKTTNVTDSESISTFIDHYTWELGNGQTLTVPADPSTESPVTNPETVSFGNTGLYTAFLTITTIQNQTVTVYNGTSNITVSYTDTLNTYSVTVGQSLAVGSSFGIAKYRGVVPSPGVLTEIVNSPGGPYSFDPQIDYETTGFEVVVNTAATLIFYNGSSTVNWFPYVADQIPTVANGEITNNYTTYTFHIRSGMGFSNGDPITAYDVYFSTIRSMLFQGGYPGTADWIISQYLVPAPYFSPFTPIVNKTNTQGAYTAIVNSVSYDNTANTVTFHLTHPTPPSLFFTAVSDPLGMGIDDANWFQSIGAGITFSPAGFLAYEAQSNEGNYNQQIQFSPAASGPFEVNTYVPHTSVVLTPNPYFPGISMIPAQNKTVILEWVSSSAVAYQLFASGQGDIVTLLTPPYVGTVQKSLVPSQQAKLDGPFPSITEFFAVFNVNINTTFMASAIGPGYSIPTDYFANPLVREAFAYAWNYTGYVDNILGNKKYSFNFGTPYCGVIVQGLPYYVPPANLTGCPAYSLQQAKSLLYQSGLYNTSVSFPIVVPSGDDTDFTASIVWAQALQLIDPNIKMSPVFVDFSTIIGYSVPGSNPMPVYFLGWIADYPYPSDYTDAMYLAGGTYPGPNGWDPTFLGGLSTTYPSQATMYNNQASTFNSMNALVSKADTDTNAAQAAQDYAQAEQLAVNLYMYVYTYQATGLWITKPWISPYNGQWGFQENPTIGAGADSFFAWWIKG